MRVIGAGQGVGPTAGEIVAPGWVQLPTGTIVDASGKPITTVSGAGPVGAANIAGQLIQQAAAPQLVATAGPGGQITYMIPGTVPSHQIVTIDGQEAIVIAGPSNANQAAFMSGGGGTIVTPSGQIIRTHGLAGGGMIPNMGFTNMGPNVVNIGGNLVNLAGMQQAVRQGTGMVQGMQTLGGMQVQQIPNVIQIPVSINGQTAIQTIQLPMQGFPGLHQAALANGGLVSLTPSNQMSTQPQNGTPMTQMTSTTPNTNCEDMGRSTPKSADKNDSAKNVNNSVANAATLLSAQQAQSLLFNQTMGSGTLANLALAPNQGMTAIIPMNANVLNTANGQMIITSQGNIVSMPSMTMSSFPQAAVSTAASSAVTATTASQNSVISTVLPGQPHLLASQNLQGSVLPQNWLQVRLPYFLFQCILQTIHHLVKTIFLLQHIDPACQVVMLLLIIPP